MKWREALVAGALASVVAVAASWAVSPPFATSWTSAYEAIPADTEAEALGAARIRDLKTQIRLRMQQDHSWAGDGNDGFHNTVTLLQQSSDPVASLDAGKTAGILYSKLVGAQDELFYKDSAGNITQVTSGGVVNVPVISSGTVQYTAAASIPAGYLACDGSAQSRTTYAALYAALGGASSPYGQGDGLTTFNLPDDRGRTIFSFDSGNASGRLTAATSQGISAAVLGNAGGQQTHTQIPVELAQHNHSITDPGHTHTLSPSNFTGFSIPGGTSWGSGGAAQVTPTIGTSTTGISLASAGNSTPFNVLPPGLVLQCIIKT